MAKKWMVVLCVFSVLTFLCSLVSAITIIVNENARTELNSTEVLASNNTYKSTSIIYDQSNELYLLNLSPGYSQSNTFTITNNHSSEIKYSIKWYNVTSNWSEGGHPEEFTYSVTCTNGEQATGKTMPSANEDLTIIEDLELKTNKSNTCTMTISFTSTGLDQSYNLNKTFKGTYKIVVKE
jgi:hypothetical protein